MDQLDFKWVELNRQACAEKKSQQVINKIMLS